MRRATSRHNLMMRVLRKRRRVSSNLFHTKRRLSLPNPSKNRTFLLQEPGPPGKQQPFHSTPTPMMCAILQTRSRAGSTLNDQSYFDSVFEYKYIMNNLTEGIETDLKIEQGLNILEFGTEFLLQQAYLRNCPLNSCHDGKISRKIFEERA